MKYFLLMISLCMFFTSLIFADEYGESVIFWDFNKTYDENFNSGVIDGDKWAPADRVHPTVNNSRLEANLQGNGQYQGSALMSKAGSNNKFKLSGDFDIRADFGLTNFDSSSGAYGGGLFLNSVQGGEAAYI